MMLPQKTIVALLASLSFVAAVPQRRATLTSPSSSSTGTASQPAASSSAPATRPGLSSVSHGAYSGSATVTGALKASSVGTGIVVGGVPPAETTYPSDGQLHDAQPAPYVPAGGLGTNTTPIYNVQSDFDYESLVCLFTFIALFRKSLNFDFHRRSLSTKSGLN